MAKRSSMRSKMKQQLGNRTKESHSRRDDSGGIKTYLDSDKISEIPTWWAGKGDHIIDIIPYFAGENDPRNKAGEPAYVLDIEVHRQVGPMEEMIVCPEQYGKPCPICEESRKKNREGADWKTVVKPLKASRRAVYNVIVRDQGEGEKKGVQLLEIAHWFMEKHLAKIAKDPRGGGFTVFSDPDEGKSISFERTGVGMENTGYSGHRFVDRPEAISDEELEAAHCLDELLDIKTYDEIHSIFWGTKEESASDDNGEEQQEEQQEKQQEKQQKEQQKEQKPKTERKRKEHKNPSCPFGGEIGVDIDELPECEDDCTLYSQCADVADEL